MNYIKTLLKGYAIWFNNPKNWCVSDLIKSIAFWALIVELPIYILCSQNILGLFLTYMISLVAILLHLVQWLRFNR